MPARAEGGQARDNRLQIKGLVNSSNLPEQSIFSRLQHSSLRQAIAAQIHFGLLTGKLKPGQRITEEETSRVMGVSRTSVREAFQEMRTLGILIASRRKTYISGGFNAREIRDAYMFRGICEALAAKEAKRNLHRTGFERLETYVRRMEEASLKKDLEAFWQADLAFHDVIWQSSQGKYLQRLLQVVTVPYHPFLLALLRKASAEDLLQIAQIHHHHLEDLRRFNSPHLRKRLERLYCKLGNVFVVLSRQQSGKSSSHTRRVAPR